MEHVHSAHVAADPDRVYAALANPDDLMQFVPQITGVSRHDGDGDRIDVEARYGGHTQKGEAFFRTDDSARTIEWGTDGGYHGSLAVEADADGSMLTLTLHTTHMDHADHDVAATLDAMRRLVEART